MKLRIFLFISVFIFLLVSCSSSDSNNDIRPEYREDAINTFNMIMEEFYAFMNLPEAERTDELTYKIYKYELLKTLLELLEKYENDPEFNKMEAEIYLQLKDLQEIISDVNDIDFELLKEKQEFIMKLLGING